MAGEWIPIDCNLGVKPEVLEVAAVTGQPVEVVVGRLVRLWSWAWFITADGTVKGSLAMLSSVAGGDEPFWQAVEQAGWLVAGDKTLTIPGWEARFSKAAKRRLSDTKRKTVFREEMRAVRKVSAKCPQECGPEERRGEERREEESKTAAQSPASRPQRVRSPAAADGIRWSHSAGWEGITGNDRSQWAAAFPAVVLDQELAKATAWLTANPEKAKRKNWRRFLVSWFTRCQDHGGSNRGTPGVRPTGPALTPEQIAARKRREAEQRRETEEYLARKAAKGAVARGEYADVDDAMAAMLARIDRQPRATA